ncbi:MAG: hypothetical protein BWK80_28415 [Desulfobacteraceae bacterium IS3]|nr:MAG: hypothetical protein BWK80_28415 [Desulfobacteraceae bacterium IS3]
MKYYFLAGYLPELQRDDRKIKVRLTELLEHIEAEDLQEVDLILLGQDVFIVEKLLSDKAVTAQHALFDAEFWKEQIKSPQEGPEFILNFLRESQDSSESFSPKSAERLYGAFYDHVLSETRNGLIRGYFGFERDLRNILAAVRARKKGLDPGEHLVAGVISSESDELTDTLCSSNAEDFGLGKDYPWVESLIAEAYPPKRQEMIEQILWNYLDENTGDDPFHFNSILSYLLKVQMLEKRLALSEEQGSAKVRKLEGR